MSEKILIANFGAFGDIINSTPIAKHYKLLNSGNVVKWITRPKYASVLKSNPYIDEVVLIDDSAMPNDNVVITKNMKQKVAQDYSDHKIIYAAPYMSHKYDGTARSTLLDIIKLESSGIDEWKCDFIPTIRLTTEEEKEAEEFFNSIKKGKTILLEYENYSGQTPYTQEYFFWLCNRIDDKGYNIILSGKEPPEYLDYAKNRYDISFYHYKDSFISNARLYNLVDYFIGNSSGITCLTSSDYCDNNKTRIEICHGYHWSSISWKHNQKNKYICFSYEDFINILSKVF